jgi:hypothetical protein
MTSRVWGLAKAKRHIRQTIDWLRPAPPCKLCASPTERRRAYQRVFYHCRSCDFIFAVDYESAKLNRGMGMEGSWSGPGGGGYREYYLAKLLLNDLNCSRFLLFETGNTPTFETLRGEGINVVGCDVSPDVVAYKRHQFGEDAFFTPEGIPQELLFDAIIAVEVIEHFAEPRASFDLLYGHLSATGLICGTTDFYQGGDLEDGSEPGYLRTQGHVAYWSAQSLSYVAGWYAKQVSMHELVCPGSVVPDEKYGRLWPNKRVFFLYSPGTHQPYFQNLRHTVPILPIDRP